MALLSRVSLKLGPQTIGVGLSHIQQVGFKSQYSLDKLYPKSSLCIYKSNDSSQKVSQSNDKFSGVIPISELTLTYSASSGPGGQNVNKVHTKVDVRFHVPSAKWLSEKLKSSILERYPPYITKDGYLVLRSDRTRYQNLNVADCLDKLRFMVREAEKPPSEPSPENETIKLARHEKAARERLRTKRHHSNVKLDRQAPVLD